MTAPLVSIVLPTYNRSGRLGRSVGSVLAQSFQDFELVIVDDGSSDATEQTVSAFADERIRLVKHEQNRGVAAARNTGTRVARGRYLAFQDSDDEWFLDKLSRQIAALEGSGDQAMSVCSVLRTGRRGGHGATWLLTYPRAQSEWVRGLKELDVLASAVAYTQSWLVPRQAVLDAGGFDESLRIWDDWDLLIRLSRRLEIRTLNAPLVISERLVDSLSADRPRFAHDIALILKKYERQLRTHRAEYGRLLYIYAFRHWKIGGVSEARAASLRALLRTPLDGASWRLFIRTFTKGVRVRRRQEKSNQVVDR